MGDHKAAVRLYALTHVKQGSTIIELLETNGQLLMGFV